MRRYPLIRVVFFLVGTFCLLVVSGEGPLYAKTKTPLTTFPSNTLQVGTTFSPPFAMQRSDGRWVGLSMALWQAVARRLGLHYRIVGMPFQQLLKRIDDKSLDAGVGAITVTSGREEHMDFSEPFYVTGLTIAVASRRQSAWRFVLQQIFSLKFIGLILGLLALLAGTGSLIWMIEARNNRQQFGGGTIRGIGSGIWWSAQTMTSVGYGDKVPRTFLGRAVGITWMIIGVIATSSFTASITAALTSDQLVAPVTGVQSLRTLRVGTIKASSSIDYLKGIGIKPRLYDHLGLALVALKDNKIDAVVYDAPLLRYAIRRRFSGQIRVLPKLLQKQYYAIALPDGSALRLAINRAVLEEISSPGWGRIRERYLGHRP